MLFRSKDRYNILKSLGKKQSELNWKKFVGKIMPAIFEGGNYFLTTNYIKAFNIGGIVKGNGPFNVLICEQNGNVAAKLV